MDLNLIIAGVGGQGNVLASQVVGRAAVAGGFEATIGETFGLSQRGGPVMSHVRLSSSGALGPLIPPNGAHIILGLEPLETLRILRDYANPETVFIVNSRPIHPLNVIAGDVEYPDAQWMKSVLEDSGGRLHWLDATPAAIELGGPIFLNMIMLGALSALPGFPLTGDDFVEALKEIFPEAKRAANIRALEIGWGMVHGNQD
ncbi:MAG: indolepyruvate oxidoreductase subunit beta [Deltaproteobacteria bacterium]|nr:indolepyruvate oxidoreductase subunit beta [Deltaproteobacteria bacterium]